VVTDQQVRRLMAEIGRHGNVTRAAQNAGMSRVTAREWLKADELPSDRERRKTRC